jgi:hypothetical protein
MEGPMLDLATMRLSQAPPPIPTTRAKRVLIVAYQFPQGPVVGALRLSFLARYLPEFGWEPSVLTKRENVGPGSARVVAVPDVFERLLQPSRQSGKFPGLRAIAHAVVMFPDRAAGWIPAAVAAGLRLTRKEHFDAVLSTSPPPSAHLVAYAIAQMRGLPWIADYHDLWCGHPNAAKGPVRSRLEMWLEHVVRRRAHAITAVHHDLLSRQHRLFGLTFGEVIPVASNRNGAHDEIAPARDVARRFAALLDTIVVTRDSRALYL